MYVAKYLVLWIGYSFAVLVFFSFVFSFAMALKGSYTEEQLHALVDISLTLSPFAGAVLLLLHHQRETKKLP